MNEPGDHLDRSAARLAAVQALYQMELTGEDAESVIEEFVAHRFGQEPDVTPGEPSESYFGEIVRGVPPRQNQIDAAIASCLASDWRLSRVDSILRAILRGGAYELMAQGDVPARVIIDEYVKLAHAFFSDAEPSFVNAALDKLAHTERPAEFGSEH